MAQLFDKIVPGHGEAMYTPEGIYHTSPNRLSYHIDANADFATRFSNQLKNVPYVGEGLSLGFDVLAPAASVIPSIGYDASQAYERMEPGSGVSGWWDAFKAENPEISIPGRMAGVLNPLASRFGYEVTGSGFKSLADKRFKQHQLMNKRKQNFQDIVRRKEEAAKQKAAADAAAKAKADAAAAAKATSSFDPSGPTQASIRRDRADKSGRGHIGGFTNPGKGSYGPHKADGGLINFYKYGGFI